MWSAAIPCLNHDHRLTLRSLQHCLSFVELALILALANSKTSQQGQDEPAIDQQPLADKRAAQPPGLANQHWLYDGTLPNHSWNLPTTRLWQLNHKASSSAPCDRKTEKMSKSSCSIRTDSDWLMAWWSKLTDLRSACHSEQNLNNVSSNSFTRM